MDVVVAPRDSRSSRCLTRLRRQRFSNFRVIVVTGQAQIVEDRHDEASPTFVASDAENVVSLLRAGAAQGDAPWVVFLEDDDEPDEAFLDTLVRAQVASEADVVTCAVSIRTESGPPATHFFHGEPGGLAALGNGYGTAALLRRTLLEDGSGSSAADNDSDWSLFARLNRNGARIVSVPIPLLARARLPGTADADPVDALVALEELERGLPDPFRSLARLAAGLAVTSESR